MEIFKRQISRWLFVATFIIYLMILLDFVFFSDYFGRVNAEVLRYSNINLEPFRTIKNYIRVKDVLNPSVFWINIVGNIAALVPFGFFVPMIFKYIRNGLSVFMLSVAFSVAIELTQGYFAVGVLDVDDVILNSIGGFIGFLVFLVLRVIIKIKRQSQSQR